MRRHHRSFPQALTFILVGLTALFVSCGSTPTPPSVPGGGGTGSEIALSGPATALDPGSKIEIKWSTTIEGYMYINGGYYPGQSGVVTGDMMMSPQEYIFEVRKPGTSIALASRSLTVRSTVGGPAVLFVEELNQVVLDPSKNSLLIAGAGAYSPVGFKGGVLPGFNGVYQVTQSEHFGCINGLTIKFIKNNTSKSFKGCFVLKMQPFTIATLTIQEWGRSGCSLNTQVYMGGSGNTGAQSITLSPYQTLLTLKDTNKESPQVKADYYAVGSAKTIAWNPELGGMAILMNSQCREKNLQPNVK